MHEILLYTYFPCQFLCDKYITGNKSLCHVGRLNRHDFSGCKDSTIRKKIPPISQHLKSKLLVTVGKGKTSGWAFLGRGQPSASKGWRWGMDKGVALRLAWSPLFFRTGVWNEDSSVILSVVKGDSCWESIWWDGMRLTDQQQSGFHLKGIYKDICRCWKEQK